MIIDVNEDRLIRLKEVYEPIELQSPSGESIFICMKDGGFEVGTKYAKGDGAWWRAWYSIQDGQIIPLAMNETNDGS